MKGKNMNIINNKIITMAVLALISFGVYANSLGNSFIWDDQALILENTMIKDPMNITAFFKPDYWKNFSGYLGVRYMPLRTLTFTFDYAAGKLNPVVYHLTNTLLHVSCVLLIYVLLSMFSKPVAFFTAFVFAVYPVHTESVVWIKNRSELISMDFFLLSCITFIKATAAMDKYKLFYGLSLGCFILSLLAKEISITLPALLVLYILYFADKQDIRKHLIKTIPFWLAAVLFMFVKFILLDPILNPQGNIPAANIRANIGAVVMTFAAYLKIMVLPYPLNALRSFTAPSSFFQIDVLVSLLVLAGVLTTIFVTYRKLYSKPISFALSWILIAIFPVSNIISIVSRPVAEQRLYIPSLGFCLLLGILFSAAMTLNNGIRTAAYVVVCLLALSYTSLTVLRNRDWKDSFTFWSRIVRQNPYAAVGHYNLALDYFKAGDSFTSLEEIKKTLALDNRFYLAFHHIGFILQQQQRYDEAKEYYKKSIKIRPDYEGSYYNLGLCYMMTGKTDEAIENYRKAVSIKPIFAGAHYNLALAYEKKGLVNDAIEEHKKAIEFSSDFYDAYNNLGALYGNMGKTEEEIRNYSMAVKYKPDNARVQFNLGVHYHQMNDMDKAEEHYRYAIKYGFNEPEVFNNLGILFSIQRLYNQAIDFYKKALDIKPDYLEAWQNLAVDYIITRDYIEAQKALKQVLNLAPGDAKSKRYLKAVEVELKKQGKQ